MNFFNGKTVLITGNTGFKGSWLSQILLNYGANVIGYSLKPNTKPNLFSILKLNKKTKNYFYDIRNFNLIKNVIKKEKPKIIFHLAAQPLVRYSYDDPLYTYETNIMGTANILQAVKETGYTKSLVMITTDKVYENKNWVWPYREIDELGGFDPYSTSKACDELIIKSYSKSFFNPKKYMKSHKTLVSSARAGNVIGGGDWAKDRIITDIVRSVFEKHEKIVIRNPNAIRPWQHVLDPLYGYMLLAKKLYEGDIMFSGPWNFAPNDSNFITVKELVTKSISAIGYGDYKFKKDDKKHEMQILKLDSSKAKTYLKWRARLDINNAIKWAFDWYRKYYEGEDMIEFTNEQIKLFGEINGR